MADEVINQLAGVAAQIRSAQNNEPDNMQELLDEWSIHFPPSLGAIGSPKAVAATLQSRTQELKELRDELEAEKVNHSREISEIMKSLNIQLHASCEGVMSERRQQLLTYEQQNADFDRQIRNAKLENDSIVGRLKFDYESEVSRIQDEFNKKILEKSNIAAQLKLVLKEAKESNILERLEADRIRQSENEDYSNQIMKLKKQLMAVQGVIPNIDSLDSFGFDSLQYDVESTVSLPCEEEKFQKKKQSMKFTGKVAKAVKQLKEVRSVIRTFCPVQDNTLMIINIFSTFLQKLLDSSRRCDENTKEINELSSRVESTSYERDSYKRCLDFEISISHLDFISTDMIALIIIIFCGEFAGLVHRPKFSYHYSSKDFVIFFLIFLLAVFKILKV